MIKIKVEVKIMEWLIIIIINKLINKLMRIIIVLILIKKQLMFKINKIKLTFLMIIC